MSTVPFPAAGRTPVLSRRAMLTVSAAAGLSGLCAGYVAVTRPLLRPAEGVDHRPLDLNAGPLAAAAENELAKRYLPDQPWAATAEWVFRNGSGRSVLFCNRFEPVENGAAVRLEPFAMVFPPKPGAADATPLTVVGEAAILRVAGSIELEHADPGRITGVTMPGPVRLRGPDGLDLQGRNFTFDESAMRLWSDEEVVFAHGPHRGRGRGLQLDLFRVGAPDAYESVAVSGVSAFRLLKEVEMELSLGGGRGGPFGTLSAGPTAPAPGTAGESPLPTTVRSAGPFVFDLNTNEAVFTEAVVASRASADGGADSLECDVLAITFVPETDEAKRLAAERRAKVAAGTLTEDDGFQTVDDDLAVRSLLAYGTTKPAVLRSPANDLTAELSRLVYDAATGVTTLTRDGGAVVTRQGPSQLVSPKVVIEPAKGDEPPAVTCVGQGWLKHLDEAGQLALSARWAESLRRMRTPDGLDLIRLTGTARVEQPQEKFTLAGDRIDLWLDPNEGEPKPGDAPAGASSSPLVASGRMEPVRLVAETVPRPDEPAGPRRVMLRSPELLADARQLDVSFVPPAEAAGEAVSEAKPSRARLVPASGRIALASAEQPARQTSGPPPAPPAEPAPVVRPRGAEPQTPPASAEPAALPDAAATALPVTDAPPPAPPEAIELIADAIHVVADRPRQDGAETPPEAPRGGQVREVHTTGGVIVRQKRGDGKEPLLLKGDRLDLFNRGEGQELVHVHGRSGELRPDGTPVRDEDWARVRDQGATLFGMNINLDRRENRAWVEGVGVLELPAKGAAGALRLDGQEPSDPPAEPEQPQTLTVWWHDGMEFDGDRATFYGHVQTMLPPDLMTCQEMEVRLTERFDFAAAGRGDAARPSARPEVAEVICKQRVRVDGERTEGGEVVEVRRAEFDEFRLDQRTGDTRAVGPGWIAFWRKGDGNRAAIAADNAVRANAALRREETPWEYLRVEFARTSDGNINRRTTTFRRDVRVVYGPVADRTRTIDPDRPDKAPPEAGWMTCEELTLTAHKKTETAPAHSAVVGEGNVRIAGRGFSGLADWVSFDESKGQYVLRSFGNRNATIAKNNADGRGAGEWAGQQITAYPAINKYSVDKAAGGGAVQ